MDLGPQGPDKADEAQQIFTQGAHATRWTETSPRVPLWKISWESAVLDMDESGGLSGSFKQVEGELFRENRAASKFSADEGRARRESGDLALNGGVVLVSISNSSTLRCDEVHYSSRGKQLITATGNVQIDGAWGRVTGLSTVIATPDLKTFATPDIFPKK